MQYIQGLGLDEVLVELKRLRQESDVRRPTPPATHVERAAAMDRPEGVSAVGVADNLMTGQFGRTLSLADSGGDDSGQTPDQASAEPAPAFVLQDTDSLRLAETVVRVVPSALRRVLGFGGSCSRMSRRSSSKAACLKVS